MNFFRRLRASLFQSASPKTRGHPILIQKSRWKFTSTLIILGFFAGCSKLQTSPLPLGTRNVAHQRASLQTSPSTLANPSPLPLSLTPCESIYDLVCKPSTFSRDPTGAVRSDEEGQREAKELLQKLAALHPTWSSAEVDEEFVRRVYTPEVSKKIRSAFDYAKRSLLSWIGRQPRIFFTAAEKAQIRDRLERVELQLPPPAHLYADEPDLISKSELLFERKENGTTVIRVGGAYLLSSQSWFNLVFSIAHELGHAIDPCETRSAGLSFPAYDRLVGCFIENHLVEMRNTRSECGHNDQLAETFADWIAVRVTAEALGNQEARLSRLELFHAAKNAVRDLCEAPLEIPDESSIEFHPSSRIRIEKIFGGNSKIRRFLGCRPLPNPTLECQLSPKPKAPLGGPSDEKKNPMFYPSPNQFPNPAPSSFLPGELYKP